MVNNEILKEDTGEAINLSAQKRADKREGTRSYIALVYVIGYLFIVFGVLVIGVFKNFELTGYKDLLLAVSGILSGPLGFIIGYYFKSNKEE
jgi:hypothetical protein